MATLKINMKSGELLEVTGRKFSHYVGAYRFWFFSHKSVETTGYDVSHFDSGKQVLHVALNSQLACLNDTKAAAKMDLNKLIARVGVERVLAVLKAG